MEDIKQFCQTQAAPEANDLNHWDINFWSERLRESRYDINEVWVPPFSLSLSNAKSILLLLSLLLFSLSLLCLLDFAFNSSTCNMLWNQGSE